MGMKMYEGYKLDVLQIYMPAWHVRSIRYFSLYNIGFLMSVTERYDIIGQTVFPSTSSNPPKSSSTNANEQSVPEDIDISPVKKRARTVFSVLQQKVQESRMNILTND